MKAKPLFEHLIAKKDLNAEQMQEVLHACVSGQFSDVQTATFLALMRAKGESIEELTAGARLLQQLAHPLDLGSHLIDIVGTGGDGKNSFNVSTAASFVVASLGIPVAKHGNRASSSKSGSADVLEQAGFRLNLNEKQLQTCIRECHLAFLFAPHYHPVMKQVHAAREALGIRTFFNVLGPLINPAQVKRQVVGVFSKDYLKPLAMVLSQLGRERFLVLSSEDGLDEISISAPTSVVEYQQGKFSEWQIRPKEHGLWHASLEETLVASPKESLALIQSVLAKEASSARDMVVLNAAAAIYCAYENLSFANAIEKAKRAIDCNDARRCFDTLLLLHQTLEDSDDE